ncbi:MAG: Hsp70 family protein [Anaerocolumna sp.]
MSKIIGIDLGTSTSEAAVYMDGKPVMIPDLTGQHIIPSVVAIDDNGDILVGSKAYDQVLLRPADTAVEVKRKMGTKEKVVLRGKEYSPVWVSAQILKYIRQYASEYLKEEISRAVITVSAYFNEQQRKETVEAGRQAGFLVERIINEPTAAALCYGLEHLEEENHILIYDLGGGTFDVTLLELYQGVLEVKASSGDNQLGGTDFDQRIIDYLIKEFQQKEGIDLSKDVYAMVKLKSAAQSCKIALSSQNSYEVVIPFITNINGTPVSMKEIVTIEIFEDLIKDLLERTRQPIEVVLKDSRLSEEDIDYIIPAGGSTRIPYVKRFIKELLNKEPVEMIDPDLSIALGAAIQAGMLNDEINAEEGILLTDVNPYALGVRASTDLNGFYYDNVMEIIIPRNVTIPVTKSKTFTTAADYQTEATVEVYQGEKEEATKNNYLGRFTLTGIPAGKAYKEKIEVKFSYDVNGMLQVEAKIVSTGDKSFIVIDMAGISSDEKVDVSGWKNAGQAIKYRSTVRKAEKLLKEELEEEDRIDLEDLLYELKKALIEECQESYITDIEDEILDLLEDYL